MGAIRRILIQAALIVLGLAPLLHAQQTQASNGPEFCPPWDRFLTPTLLDVLISPGVTFR